MGEDHWLGGLPRLVLENKVKPTIGPSHIDEPLSSSSLENIWAVFIYPYLHAKPTTLVPPLRSRKDGVRIIGEVSPDKDYAALVVRGSDLKKFMPGAERPCDAIPTEV